MGLWGNIKARFTRSDRYPRGARSAYYFRGSTLVDEDNSMQVAAFNRGLIYISSQIAKLPWDIKDTENKIIKQKPSDLLNLAPNPEMNAFVWRLVMVQQAILHGNSYAEIERDGIGRPVALWPLESRCMDLVRTETGKLLYRYNNGSNGETVYLDPFDVFHLRNFHTKDGLTGQGVVAYGREVLGISIASDVMASGIFHNGGIPSGVLSHPAKLSDEAYARLKESWIAQAGGKKTGGTAILEEGVKYEPLNTQPEALQFLQSRQFGVLEIARFLGIPPTKLFDVAAATYSNVENANLEVCTDTLDSWATNLEMEADIKLLNYRYGGRFTDIDLYAVFRGDMKTRSEYFKTMMSIGAMTPNQVREREGQPGYKDGDKYYISTNNLTPADRVDELLDADIKQKTKPATAPQDNTPAKPDPKPANELEEAAISYLKKLQAINE